MKKDFFDILNFFDENNEDISIRELAQLSGINRNTIAKYLNALVLRGDIEEKNVGMTKLYRRSDRIPEKGILQIVIDPACILNHDFNIVSSNISFKNLFPKIESSSKPFLLSSLSEEFLEHRIRKSFESAISGKFDEEKITLKIRGNSYLYNLKFLPILLYDNSYGCGIVFHDETKTQSLSGKLDESENRYQAIINDQLDLVCRREPNLTLTFVNQAYCETARRSKDELVGKRLFPFALSMNTIETESIYRQVSPANPIVVIETRDIGTSGLVNWQQWRLRGIFSSDGEIIEYQAIGRDITPLKRCEEQIRVYQSSLEYLIQERTKELQKANQDLMDELVKREKNEVLLLEREMWFQTLFNNIFESCLIFEQMKDGKPSRIIEVNERACTLLHYSREELLTKVASDITTDTHWKDYSQNLAKILVDYRVLKYVGVGKRKDGETFPIEISSHRFTLQKNPVVLMICREIDSDNQIIP